MTRPGARASWRRWAVVMALAVPVRGDAAAAVQRAFHVSYIARIAGLPAGAKHIQIWVPLATSRDGQQILRRTIQAGVPYDVDKDPIYGNDILHAALTPPVPATLELQVEYDALVEGGNRLADAPADAASLPPGVQTMYLRAERLTVIDDQVRRMAAEATRGRATTVERARAIYECVIRHMQYDKQMPGWGRGDVVRACAVGKGNCTDFHSLFIAMARAAGIPARFKIGATVPSDAATSTFGYHCWAEFYVPERGWIPVDASEAWKHPERLDEYFGTEDMNKLTVSVGRDLRLAPAQQGEPVNIFIRPYVEVDGRPFDGVEMQFQWRSESAQPGGTV